MTGRFNAEGLTQVPQLPHSEAWETLELEDNALSHLGGIEAYLSLRNLFVGGNALTDLHPLEQRESLQTLVANRNRLIDVDAVSGLRNLRVLGISANPSLKSLKPLGGLRQLTHLYMGGIRPEDWSFLPQLPALLHLYCSPPSLELLRDSPPSLRELVLHCPQLSDCRPLAHLPQLRHLEITHARELTDIDPLGHLSGLERLSLAFTGVSVLEPLFSLPLLRWVDLRGTPASQNSGYRFPGHWEVRRF